MSNYQLPMLPLPHDFRSPEVLLALNAASRQLAELKGLSQTIPNQRILTNTLVLREARQSSAIENVVTTQDELYRAEIDLDERVSAATKEVQRYANALRYGFDLIRDKQLITQNVIIAIQSRLEQNEAGIRRREGTLIKNELTGETVHRPPQHYGEIMDYLKNLEEFINDATQSDLDPLIKMAVIHHQFESIHPFYDGNGRTGRILNILYLVFEGLLELPILYLSGYIIQTKQQYYRLLREVQQAGAWDQWVCYMLNGVEQTARNSTQLITDIRALMLEYKQAMRDLPRKIYSQDLLNNLFRQPYTKVEAVAEELQIHRNTARTYLDTLVDNNLLRKQKIGRTPYYVNDRLFEILSERDYASYA